VGIAQRNHGGGSSDYNAKAKKREKERLSKRHNIMASLGRGKGLKTEKRFTGKTVEGSCGVEGDKESNALKGEKRLKNNLKRNKNSNKAAEGGERVKGGTGCKGES